MTYSDPVMNDASDDVRNRRSRVTSVGSPSPQIETGPGATAPTPRTSRRSPGASVSISDRRSTANGTARGAESGGDETR